MAVPGPVDTTKMSESTLAMQPDHVSVDFSSPMATEIAESPADRQQPSGDVDVVNAHFSDAVTIYDDEKQAILSFLNYIHDKPHDVAAWSLEVTARRRRKAVSSTRKNRRPPGLHSTHDDPTSMSPVSPTSSSLAPRLLAGLHDHKRKPGFDSHESDTSSDGGSATVTHPKKLKKDRHPSSYCICHASHAATPNFHAMIACDNKQCRDPTNWYHFPCVGLQSPPDTTWHCPDCSNGATANGNVVVPENLFRKPALSITYGDMIATALRATACGEGTFKEICEFIERRYESQLNWKLESDQRKAPVWKSSVRKILFSNNRFARHPTLKGVFCLVVQPPASSSPLTA